MGSTNPPIGNQVKPISQKSINFIQELHKHIVRSPLLRQKVQNKNESQIQTELRPIIFNYMVKHFQNQNWKNPEKGAKNAFFWEGQE